MSKGNTADTKVGYGTWKIGGPRHFYREGLILKNLKKFVPQGRVLDVGCGTGSLVARLAQQGYEVYGIDMSEDCIRVTSKRLGYLPLNKGGEIKKGSALKIPYPENFFDAIIAAEVLEHLEEDSLAVKEFSRVLRPDGYCLITVPSNQRLWDIWDEMAGHKRRYGREDLLKLFNNQSFSIDRLFSWGFPLMRLYHRLVFLKWARHVGKKMGGTISTVDKATRIGLSRPATHILGNIFCIDNLFGAIPWGIGILLVARKV